MFFRVLLNCLHLSDGGHSRPYSAHSQRFKPSFAKNTLASFLAEGDDSTSDHHLEGSQSQPSRALPKLHGKKKKSTLKDLLSQSSDNDEDRNFDPLMSHVEELEYRERQIRGRKKS